MANSEPSSTPLDSPQQAHTETNISAAGSPTIELDLDDGTQEPVPGHRKCFWIVVLYLWDELRSISKLQWLIMALLAIIVAPWTYRSYRYAAWTARLNYLQECRTEIDTLIGKAKEDCEAAIREGVKPPPGFDLPSSREGVNSLLSEIAAFENQQHDGTYEHFGVVSLPTYLYELAAATAVVTAFVLNFHRDHRRLIPTRAWLMIDMAYGAAVVYYAVAVPSFVKLHWYHISEYQQECLLGKKVAEHDLSHECTTLTGDQVIMKPKKPMLLPSQESTCTATTVQPIISPPRAHTVPSNRTENSTTMAAMTKVHDPVSGTTSWPATERSNSPNSESSVPIEFSKQSSQQNLGTELTRSRNISVTATTTTIAEQTAEPNLGPWILLGLRDSSVLPEQKAATETVPFLSSEMGLLEERTARSAPTSSSPVNQSVVSPSFAEHSHPDMVPETFDSGFRGAVCLILVVSLVQLVWARGKRSKMRLKRQERCRCWIQHRGRP